MCLAIPMRLTAIEECRQFGLVELDGFVYRVNLSLIEQVQIGDYLLVHAGTAIEKLDLEVAEENIRLFAELASSLESSTGE